MHVADKKSGYTKAGQAENLLSLLKRLQAPEEVQDAAYDALQSFIAASDCRQGGNRSEAARQQRQGDKKLEIARTWLEQNK